MVPLPLLFRISRIGALVSFGRECDSASLPTARRCFKLGQALESCRGIPSDERVAVVGTGGMSHQLHGERFGHLNSEFDENWLKLIQDDPEQLANLSHVEIMKSAGAEAVELIMWLVMRGAMAPTVKQTYRNYYAPMTTGMGLIAMVDS